jgi:hypothetical protein
MMSQFANIRTDTIYIPYKLVYSAELAFFYCDAAWDPAMQTVTKAASDALDPRQRRAA